MNKEKINVLHVCDLILGGVETFFINVLENKNHEQFQFDVFTKDTGKGKDSHEEYVENLGVKVIKWTPLREKGAINRYKKRIAELRKYINENKYDVIHVHSSGYEFTFTALLCKLAGAKKILLHSHNSATSERTFKARIKQLTMMKIMKLIIPFFVDNYLACSKEAAQYFFSKGQIKSNKFKLIYNGIEAAKFKFDIKKRKEIRKRYHISENTLVIGSITRITTQKNIFMQIDLLKVLVEKNIDVKCLLAGKGYLDNELGQYIQEKGLEKYIIWVKETKEVPSFLAAMDIFLLTSIYEGLPFALIEAQANGLKCLISDKVSKQSEITNLVQFLPISKVEPWVEEILKIKDTLTLENRESYGEKVENSNFSIKTTVKQLEEVYKS